MKKQLIVFVLVIMMLITMLAGCIGTSKSSPSTSSTVAKKVIGICIADFSNQFQTYIKAGMEEATESLKDRYEFVYSDAKMDTSKQLQQVENLVAQNVSAIILIAVDAEGSMASVETATKASIPIIDCNTPVKDITKVTSYVGSDTIESGRLEMQALAEKLGGKGNIVEIQGSYGHEPQINRHNGILEVLKKYPDIKVLAEDTGNWNRPEGMAKMENWLQSDIADKIDAVVAHNDEMAIGAYKAIEDVGKLGKIKIAGIDATPEMLDLLATGKVDVTVFQDAKGQGKKAIEVAVMAVEGQKVEHQYMIPYQLVKPEEVEKFKALYN